MAGPTIDQAFITKFNADVHMVYQQDQSLLRGTVRTDADVAASKVRFQILGTTTAKTKARQGEIPSGNPAHSYVEATMSDYYTLDYIDKLDLTKLNIDIRGNYVKNHANAFARTTDDIIIAAMNTGYTFSTNSAGTDYSGNLTRNAVNLWIEQLDSNYVPNDMMRYALITPRGWNFLMALPQFADSDFTGPDLPYMRRTETRTWNGVHWIKSNRLPGKGTNQCTYFMWHMESTGHGISDEVDITWDWENERKAWSAAGSMSMGAVVIDPIGICAFRCDDTATPPVPTIVL